MKYAGSIPIKGGEAKQRDATERFQCLQLGTSGLSPSRRGAKEISLECAPLIHCRSIHMGILTLQIFGTAALFVSHLFVVIRNRLVAGR